MTSPFVIPLLSYATSSAAARPMMVTDKTCRTSNYHRKGNEMSSGGKRKVARGRVDRKLRKQTEFIDESRQERLKARALIIETKGRIVSLEAALAKAEARVAHNIKAFEHISDIAMGGAIVSSRENRPHRPRIRTIRMVRSPRYKAQL